MLSEKKTKKQIHLGGAARIRSRYFSHPDFNTTRRIQTQIQITSSNWPHSVIFVIRYWKVAWLVNVCTALHLLFVQTDTRATKQKGAVRLFIFGGYARRKTRRRSELTECVENAPAKRCGCEPLQPSFNLLCCSHGRTWKLSITFFSPCSWRGVARRSDTMSAGARTHSHTQKQFFFSLP